LAVGPWQHWRGANIAQTMGISTNSDLNLNDPSARSHSASAASSGFGAQHTPCGVFGGTAAYAVAPRSYQPRDPFTILTTDSMTGTSISTPTTVARAAPD
jgi:hypothetical protein